MPSMKPETYYRDHWLDVDPERVEAYESMFRWRPEMAPLLAPAEIAEGQTVVDYGCGPGLLSLELAQRVGASGRVHAVDINDLFLRRAEGHAEAEKLRERIVFHRIAEDRLPLDDASVDRVVCKNVLEYVDDPVATLSDFRRTLRPGGRVHAIDSDWGMLVVEPVGPERVARLFDAASIAYRTPLIGRKLHGFMRRAGFEEVRVAVLAAADTAGRFAPILFNMAKYARESGQLPDAEIERFVREVEAAVGAGTYLLVLPQFLVTGIAPGPR
jgi:ubiquinone/menaquinone biosynthesis C-methylase UbiE